MIQVLLSFLIIFVTSYSTGSLIKRCFEKIMRFDCDMRMTVVSLIGVAAINVWAEIFSLFSGVKAIAFAPVALITVIGIALCGKSMIEKIRQSFSCVGLIIAYALIILLMAYGTSGGYMHYDTNLYHAQAIRWIEEYGVVPGLANLQLRFGYNSAEFALNALYGMKWLFGQSLHTAAGYFAMCSCMLLTDLRFCFHRDETGRISFGASMADYVRVGLFFYLCTIFGEMTSPASDYFAQLLIFDIVILWLENDRKERNTDCYAALCLLIVYAITIKLSIGLLVLLAIKPAVRLIKSKEWKKIWGYLISGFVIALPYFVRNHIISGWLLYPSTILSLGHPDWQVPKGTAQYDAREIGMWGRGITDASRWKDVTSTNWISDWFLALGRVDRLLVVGGLCMLMVGVILIVYQIATTFIMKRRTATDISVSLKDFDATCDFAMIFGVIAVGTIFWWQSAPLVRYGYAYLIILPLLTLGYIIEKLPRLIRTAVFVVIATITCVIKCKAVVLNIASGANIAYFVKQMDYIDGDAFTYEVDGATIYVANDSGQIGYYKFPATPEQYNDFALRGNDISDGFVTIQ